MHPYVLIAFIIMLFQEIKKIQKNMSPFFLKWFESNFFSNFFNLDTQTKRIGKKLFMEGQVGENRSYEKIGATLSNFWPM